MVGYGLEMQRTCLKRSVMHLETFERNVQESGHRQGSEPEEEEHIEGRGNGLIGRWEMPSQ